MLYYLQLDGLVNCAPILGFLKKQKNREKGISCQLRSIKEGYSENLRRTRTWVFLQICFGMISGLQASTFCAG
jgi:hypothetical protein